MWPWQRFEIVKVGGDGGASCETVAAIVMILRLYKIPVELEQVEQAFDEFEDDNARTVAHVTRRFGLACRGLQLDDLSLLPTLMRPCIAHRTPKWGAFPCPLRDDCYFHVVERITYEDLTVLDARNGQRLTMPHKSFAATSTGVFLEFERAPNEIAPARIVKR